MDFDFFVIGAGSGGVASARRAASHGAKVAVAEEWDLGGTCVNRGCVPKKLLVYASQLAYEFELARGYGYRVESSFDWPTFRAKLHQELSRLQGFYRKLLSDNQVAVYPTRATLAGPNTVKVGEETVSARHILVAVGGRPVRVPFEGCEHALVSDDVFHLAKLPRHLMVLGSGYIGMEMSGIFRGLGCQVTLGFRSPLGLPSFDQDVREHLHQEMTRKGIRILPETRPLRLEKTPEGFVYHSQGAEPVPCDAVLCACGREPYTRGLGLEEAGVELREDGSIVVNHLYQTSVPSIHAVGDCTGHIQLTPVAIAEGRALAETLFNDNPSTVPYDVLPTAVFSQPAVGTVGLTEAQARERYGEVDVYRTVFRPMKVPIAGGEEKVLLKLVVERASDRVVGCHIVANEGPELAQVLGVALRAGASKRDFDTTIALHPTLAEELVLLRERV